MRLQHGSLSNNGIVKSLSQAEPMPNKLRLPLTGQRYIKKVEAGLLVPRGQC